MKNSNPEEPKYKKGMRKGYFILREEAGYDAYQGQIWRCQCTLYECRKRGDNCNWIERTTKKLNESEACNRYRSPDRLRKSIQIEPCANAEAVIKAEISSLLDKSNPGRFDPHNMIIYYYRKHPELLIDKEKTKQVFGKMYHKLYETSNDGQEHTKDVYRDIINKSVYQLSNQVKSWSSVVWKSLYEPTCEGILNYVWKYKQISDNLRHLKQNPKSQNVSKFVTIFSNECGKAYADVLYDCVFREVDIAVRAGNKGATVYLPYLNENLQIEFNNSGVQISVLPTVAKY